MNYEISNCLIFTTQTKTADNKNFTVSTNSKLLEDTKKQKDVLKYDANIKKDCFITLSVSTTSPSKKRKISLTLQMKVKL